MPLPATGPTTRDLVKAHLQIGEADSRDDDRIDSLVRAVNSRVRDWPVADKAVYDTQEAADDAEDGGWPDSIIEGATMLTSRLWSRKDSPDGVSAVNEFGPVYVRRHDPDVAMLLELGEWSAPAVG